MPGRLLGSFLFMRILCLQERPKTSCSPPISKHPARGIRSKLKHFQFLPFFSQKLDFLKSTEIAPKSPREVANALSGTYITFSGRCEPFPAHSDHCWGLSISRRCAGSIWCCAHNTLLDPKGIGSPRVRVPIGPTRSLVGGADLPHPERSRRRVFTGQFEHTGSGCHIKN